jgi:predicted permease
MNFWYELAYTMRVLKKRIGFSLLCVLVIALGYTVTIPLYAIVKNFAYVTLPFPDGDRLVIVSQIDTLRNGEMTTSSFDEYQYNEIEQSVSTLESLSAFHELAITLSEGEYAERFFGGRITAETLSYAATNPILGRPFEPADEAAGAEKVVLLGYGVWQRYYGGDTSIIGKSSRVNQTPHTIIGVMPEGFSYPQSAQLWLPLSIDNAAQPGTSPRVSIIGKLATGVSRSEAALELAELVERQSREFPEIYGNRSAKIIPFTHGMFTSAFTIFNSMAGMAICIYLLVCLNIGNLLLIRANDRVNELAVRKAVGSNRAGLFATVLLESFVICLIGAVAGVLFARGSLGLLQALVGIMFPDVTTRPFWLDFSLNLGVLTVMVLLMVTLWLISGAFAAWRVSSKDITETLGHDSKGSASKQTNRITRLLVGTQVVLSFFLLVLSGSYLFVFQNAASTFEMNDSDLLVSGQINLNSESYQDPRQREIYRQSLKQLILSDNDFQDLSYSSVLPGNGLSRVQAYLENPDGVSGQSAPIHAVNWVDSSFYDTFEFEMIRGRAFNQFDSPDAEPVIIVDQAFVDSMSIDESIVGRSIYLQGYPRRNNANDNAILVRVVGIAPYLGPDNSQSSITPRIYRPLSQDSPTAFRIVVKLHPETRATLAELERKIKIASSSIDRDLSIYGFQSVSAIREIDSALPRLLLSMFASVAVGALILAVVGVYGLVSRSVYSRRSEIGIRRAIGSSNFNIIWIFLRQALIYLSAGVVIGGGLALLVINVTSSSVFGGGLLASLVSVLVIVTCLVGALLIFASYIPARRVVAMEPGEALHYE